MQVQKDGEPIADPSKIWRGDFVCLASLSIHPTKEPLSNGEGLSLNPWRVLAEHQPLGWPGRTRKLIYQLDFQWRTSKNKSKSAQ